MSVASTRNTGQSNLGKAKFFLSQVDRAEQAEPFDPVAVEAYLDAAIVFGKATQDWMADQYGGQAWLKNSPMW